MIAQSTGAPGWVADLSPFAHLSAVLDTAPDWSGVGGLLAVAVLLAVAGAAGYGRRDLAVQMATDVAQLIAAQSASR